jgi:hypothetical protein
MVYANSKRFLISETCSSYLPDLLVCITCRLMGDEVQMCGQGGSKAGIKGKGLVSFVHSYSGF